MVAEQKDGNKQERQHCEQHLNVFQLTAHHDRPFGVGRMVDDCPEKAAGAEREEERKRKQPRIT